MLIVVAHREDPTARYLADAWRQHDCAVLTCADLSLAGWCHDPGDPAASIAVLGGEAVAASEITAVVTRLPCVLEQELVDIVPGDRAYVAAEMTAFLLSWLSALPCPVVNRPTPTCLAGPYWRPERWMLAAATMGLGTPPLRRTAPQSAHEQAADAADGESVTVVGDQVIGTTDAALRADALMLAHLAGADLLGVRLARRAHSTVFLGADIWPDLTDERIASALLEHLGVERAALARPAAGGS